jgi:hypothetical protein
VSATTIAAARASRPFLTPTLAKQCWGFMIGSAFFALGSTPGLSAAMGSDVCNLLFFIGAWFFTSAGLIQLFLSGPVSAQIAGGEGRAVRAEWLAAATQSFGTILFNVSTTAALLARSLTAQEHFVWRPDAGGSVAFLVSGVLAIVAYARAAAVDGTTGRGWSSVVINLVGCVAFGVSAVGAYTLPGGDLVSATLANGGTFVGALCFLVASLIALPAWGRRRSAT